MGFGIINYEKLFNPKLEYELFKNISKSFGNNIDENDFIYFMKEYYNTEVNISDLK